MHILHVIDTLRPGGAQRSLVEIANQTVAEGAQVSVCVTRSGIEMAAGLRPGIAVTALERTRRFDWKAMRMFSQLLDQQRIDVVHSHGRTTFSFLALLKATGMIQQPLVMHDHSGKTRRESPAPWWFRAWGRRHVAHYVGVCSELGAWAEDAGISAERRSVIHGAIDMGNVDLSRVDVIQRRRDDPGAEFGARRGALLGICLGGVRPEKGIDTLLGAVALCRHRGRHRGAFQIVVVGGVRDESYLRHCLRESERLGVGNSVLFAGERTDVHDWLGSFDFAVHAARSESGPLALIEHLSAALPVVATRVGEISQRAEELGVEGFVPAEDSNALAAALNELVAATPAQRAERGLRGRQIALHHFDIRSVMPAWRLVYQKAISGAPEVYTGEAVYGRQRRLAAQIDLSDT